MTSLLEATLSRLREAGCAFPISRKELNAHFVYDLRLVRQMAREGLLQKAEIYDSTLPESCLRALEYLGVESRAHFRQKYRTGEIDEALMQRIRNIGSHNIRRILHWSGLPPPDISQSVTFQLSNTACDGLQRLKKHLNLPSLNLVLECLIAGAVRAADRRETLRLRVWRPSPRHETAFWPPKSVACRARKRPFQRRHGPETGAGGGKDTASPCQPARRKAAGASSAA